MSDDPIVRRYHAEKNPDGGFLIGVPLRDLTASEFEALAEWQQASVDAAPFFTATTTGKAAKARAAGDDAKES